MTMSMKELLSFDFEGSMVRRYHTVPQIHVNTDGHHQRGVAVLCKYLWPGLGEPRVELIFAALFHDQAEQITSDVSAPAKRKLGISKVFADFEHDILRTAGLCYEDQLTDEERRVMKLADILDGALWCIHERKLGNLYAGLIYSRFRSYVKDFVVTDQDREVIEAIDELWEEVNGIS